MVRSTSVLRLAALALLLLPSSLSRAEGPVPGKTATHALVHNHDDVKYIRAAALPRPAEVSILYGVPLSTPAVLQVRAPAGFVIPYHHHPLDELITLIKGTVDIEQHGQKTMRIQTGGLMVMPAGRPHLARCVGPSECILRLHPPGPWAIVYENPADDPRKTAQR
jgi:quercetin dioxygenase-like cupin family protein